MMRLSKWIDTLSNFLAQRKGLLPLIGLFLIIVNFCLRMIAPGWPSNTDLFLHLGIVVAILGFMFNWAL